LLFSLSVSLTLRVGGFAPRHLKRCASVTLKLSKIGGEKIMQILSRNLFLSAILTLMSVACASAQSKPSDFRLPSLGTPCAEGVISVEAQENAPLQIIVEESDCKTTQMARVRFTAKNLSSKAIVEFTVRSLQTYEQYYTDTSGSTVGGFENPLKPNETYDRGFIGGGTETKAGGIPVGKMKSYILTVWSVTFADGTKWERESSKEVRDSTPNR
jgi:hypothetical protein